MAWALPWGLVRGYHSPGEAGWGKMGWLPGWLFLDVGCVGCVRWVCEYMMAWHGVSWYGWGFFQSGNAMYARLDWDGLGWNGTNKMKWNGMK